MRLCPVLPWLLPSVLAWASTLVGCAADEAAKGPSPEEVCRTEVRDLQAYVARVAGSRGTWGWAVGPDVVMREGESFPADGGDGRVGVHVGADGILSASSGPASSMSDVLGTLDGKRLALAFAPDVTMGRVREVLAGVQAAGVSEADLVFEQFKPTGPPEPSGARPLIDRLSACTDCTALRAQLRVRLAGDCLPVADALWTDDVDNAAPFSERVASGREWAGRIAAGMEECVCVDVDAPGLWDVAWQRLSDPRPLTAVPVVLAPPRQHKSRRQATGAPVEPALVRTIALPDEVLWRDAHEAFASAVPYEVHLTQ